MAEAEGEHRRKMEELALAANIEAMRRSYKEARVGQVCALVITIAFVLVGGYVAIQGQPWAGGILGSLGLTGVVSAFIWGRSRKREIDIENENESDEELELPAEAQPHPTPPQSGRSQRKKNRR